MISIEDLFSMKTEFWYRKFAGVVVALAIAPGLLIASTVRVDNSVGNVTFTVTATRKLDMDNKVIGAGGFTGSARS